MKRLPATRSLCLSKFEQNWAKCEKSKKTDMIIDWDPLVLIVSPQPNTSWATAHRTYR